MLSSHLPILFNPHLHGEPEYAFGTRVRIHVMRKQAQVIIPIAHVNNYNPYQPEIKEERDWKQAAIHETAALWMM